jgi:hypothetical protein
MAAAVRQIFQAKDRRFDALSQGIRGSLVLLAQKRHRHIEL